MLSPGNEHSAGSWSGLGLEPPVIMEQISGGLLALLAKDAAILSNGYQLIAIFQECI